MKHIAVIGASLAGLSAARALRSQGFEGTVTVVGAEVHRPYDRPPLSKRFLTGELTADDLALEGEGEQLDVHWRLGVAATGLDLGARSVELSDDTQLRADGFVLATGAHARALPGSPAIGGVHTLRTIEDAEALRRALVPGARLIVVGAGFIGAEVAGTARSLGLDVTVIEALAVPMLAQLGPEMGAALATLHDDHGTRLICGIGVATLTTATTDVTDVNGSIVTGVTLTDGRHLPADVVLVGIGATPTIEWLASSGLASRNGVLCDAGGASSVATVVAAGDCAAWLDPSTGTHHRQEHWTSAIDQPAIAVATLLNGGVHQGAGMRAPYFWSDQYGARIQFAGSVLPGDEVVIEDGSVAERAFLAVYRRAGEPVAVLSLNRGKLFTRWRRQLQEVS